MIRYPVISAVSSVILLSACTTWSKELARDSRDAAWDPGPAQLFDQIPNWDDAAMRICCGALLGDRARWHAARCDTATPVPPRSSRC